MKIPISDKESILKAIKDAEGKAFARCLDINDIEDIVMEAENKMLAKGIPKSKQIGAQYFWVVQDYKYTSFKFRKSSTAARFVKGSKSWYLTKIYRTLAEDLGCSLYLKDSQLEIVYKFMLKQVFADISCINNVNYTALTCKKAEIARYINCRIKVSTEAEIASWRLEHGI